VCRRPRRRQGSIASLIATHAAASFDPKGKLRPGERAVVMCLACDRHQAAIVFNYIKAYFEEVPALKKMVSAITAESVELTNRVVIEVHTNSFRSVRGRSLLCAVLDEVALWRDDSTANPDTETYAAITPGLAHVPNSMLVLISTAHRRLIVESISRALCEEHRRPCCQRNNATIQPHVRS